MLLPGKQQVSRPLRLPDLVGVHDFRYLESSHSKPEGNALNSVSMVLALLLFASTLRTPPLPASVSSVASSQTETEIVELEYAMMQASKNGDRQTLERLISEDFLLTTGISNGKTIDKRGYIDGYPNLVQVDSFRLHDFTVRLFGRTAVLICRLDWESRWAGMEWESNFVLTDVWFKSERSWQIVSRHSSYAAAKD